MPLPFSLTVYQMISQYIIDTGNVFLITFPLSNIELEDFARRITAKLNVIRASRAKD